MIYDANLLVKVWKHTQLPFGTVFNQLVRSPLWNWDRIIVDRVDSQESLGQQYPRRQYISIQKTLRMCRRIFLRPLPHHTADTSSRSSLNSELYNIVRNFQQRVKNFCLNAGGTM